MKPLRLSILITATPLMVACSQSAKQEAPTEDKASTTNATKAVEPTTASADRGGVDLSSHGLAARIDLPESTEILVENNEIVLTPDPDNFDAIDIVVERQVSREKHSLEAFKRGRSNEGFAALSENKSNGDYTILLHKHEGESREWVYYRYVASLGSLCSVGQSLRGFTTKEWDAARRSVEKQGSQACSTLRPSK